MGHKVTVPAIDITAVSIALSTVSVLVALVSFVMNYRLEKREDIQSQELARLQLKLQELQLLREEAAAEKLAESKVEAHHVTIGTKSHRLRVANTGGVTVTDVTCTIDGDNGPYDFIQDKEPFERLDPGESFDETLLFAMGSPSKFIVTTHWKDPEGMKQSRENIVTW